MKEIDKENLKNIVADILFDEPMSRHTSFRIGGKADVFINASSSMEIGAVLKYCTENNVPYTYIGNGTNILVSDNGIEGVVISLGANMSKIQVVDNLIYAEAGVLMSKAANAALKAELSGLEALAGIPGTIGGAVFMNAGAYGAEIKDVLKNVTYVMPNGDVVTVDASELQMSYRHSIFAENGGIVTACCMQLRHGDFEEINNKMKDYAQRRRDKQPLEFPSAGSTFKRPKGDFAGRLIQASELMGYTVGGAQVSEKHAGFVINIGGATAYDVLALIHDVLRIVKEKQGVELEPEVRFIGREMQMAK